MNEFIQHMMVFGVLGGILVAGICVGVLWILWIIGLFDMKDPR